MRRGTTPTHVFTLPFDAALIKSVRVIYSQANQAVVKKETSDCTMDGNTLTVKLTQKDTLSFRDREAVEIQLRLLATDGNAFASDIVGVPVWRCLDDEVLT